jgi:hypothetical protein
MNKVEQHWRESALIYREQVRLLQAELARVKRELREWRAFAQQKQQEKKG